MKIIILTILSFSFAGSIAHAKCAINENQLQMIINLAEFNLEENKIGPARNLSDIANAEVAKHKKKECQNHRFSNRLPDLNRHAIDVANRLDNLIPEGR